MKIKIFAAFLAIFGLGACDASDVAQKLAQYIIKNQKAPKHTEKIAPKQNELGLTAINTLPEHILNATAKSHQASLQYTPHKNVKVYHYTAQGELADAPQISGFYREILGVTADGRTVAQDRYQESQLLQTAPFVLKKDAEDSSFDSADMDGEGIWFAPDGSLESYQPFEYLQFQFRNGKLWSQSNTADKTQAYYHDDGTTVLAHINNANHGILTLFREDGGAIVQIHLDEKQKFRQRFAWDAQGKSVPFETVEQEVRPLFERYSKFTGE